MSDLTTIEREARVTRGIIAELEGLTQKFDQALVRAETERNLHLAKIEGERAKLGELIDAAALIVQNLGSDAPAEPVRDELDEIVDELFGETAGTLGEAAQSVVDGLEVADPESEPQADAPTFATIAAAVEQIAGSPPEPDASDEPEMTDYQVEAIEDQTRQALAEDAAVRELETVGDDRPARRFNPFAGNPFA